ncbi:hypothetical protein AB1K83_12245 [Sporosarcina sp. 179-K 3D1 HS]|uniref:cysteine dioxygenase family protein n=1 Tax=Sporosarcina sp. 179-K 3D1 HS TaxID=3232169 RepID=UPI0039A23F0C
MLLQEQMHPKLRSFIEDIESIINENNTEQVTTQKVSDFMKVLLEDDSIIPPNYKIPNPNKYTLFPVYIDPRNRFCIASAVWDVGQSTPIHDHGTWGVIGIVQGEELEIHYEMDSDNKLVPVSERIFAKGDTAVCCTSDRDLHKVQCISPIPCVGIHVYGGNIGVIERHMYDTQTGEKMTVVTSWDAIPTS